MELFRTIASNYVLTLCGLSWIAAQVMKFVINYIFARKFKFERLYGSGGMPSAHTALVTALVMGVAKVSGLGSTEFVISAVLAAVVIYDSLGVRRAAGEHARVLNKIMDKRDYPPPENAETDVVQKQLKELLGHTPMEVLGGAMLGIIISMMYRY